MDIITSVPKIAEPCFTAPELEPGALYRARAEGDLCTVNFACTHIVFFSDPGVYLRAIKGYAAGTFVRCPAGTTVTLEQA